MKKIFIDEYLSIQLRKHIDELVDLNLDLESILSLLSNDLYGYSDYMIIEIKRYIMYIMWLHDNHKDRSLAFEKYKKKTNQTKLSVEERKKDSSNDLSKELLLEQLRKERQRIDEVSRFKQYSNSKLDENKIEKPDNHQDKINEILETLSDDEIQETLSEILTTAEELETKTNKAVFEDENVSSHAEITTNEDSHEITFEDILLEEKNENSINSRNSKTLTLFDFDLFELEDNGTQTLDDSFFLEEEVVELEDIVDSRDSEKTLESEINSETTKKALDFVEMLEQKYGDQTVLSLNEEEYDLKSQDFTLAELTDTLRIGTNIRYKNQIYLVKGIENKLDLFNHEQTILILSNPEINDEIRINAKKIKQML